MEYTGKVTFIWDRDFVGANNLEKITICLEEATEKEFKWSLSVDFFNDKIDLLNGVNVGDVITVHINTKTFEHKTIPGKYFNSITVWKLDKQKPTKVEQDDLPF